MAWLQRAAQRVWTGGGGEATISGSRPWPWSPHLLCPACISTSAIPVPGSVPAVLSFMQTQHLVPTSGCHRQGYCRGTAQITLALACRVTIALCVQLPFGYDMGPVACEMFKERLTCSREPAGVWRGPLVRLDGHSAVAPAAGLHAVIKDRSVNCPTKPQWVAAARNSPPPEFAAAPPAASAAAAGCRCAGLLSTTGDDGAVQTLAAPHSAVSCMAIHTQSNSAPFTSFVWLIGASV